MMTADRTVVGKGKGRFALGGPTTDVDDSSLLNEDVWTYGRTFFLKKQEYLFKLRQLDQSFLHYVVQLVLQPLNMVSVS